MAYSYHVDFSQGCIIGSRPITVRPCGRIKKNSETTKKCYERDLCNDKTVPVKSINTPWLYGSVTSLVSQKIIYPCTRYRCAIPCECRLCQKKKLRCLKKNIVTVGTVKIISVTMKATIDVFMRVARFALRLWNWSPILISLFGVLTFLKISMPKQSLQ